MGMEMRVKKCTKRWFTSCTVQTMDSEVSGKQNESCPRERAFNSTVGVHVSENTGPTYEHDTQCVTVTAKNRWREILAR